MKIEIECDHVLVGKNTPIYLVKRELSFQNLKDSLSITYFKELVRYIFVKPTNFN